MGLLEDALSDGFWAINPPAVGVFTSLDRQNEGKPYTDSNPRGVQPVAKESH